jgi:POT family proton-dependent oligopeptide transporter
MPDDRTTEFAGPEVAELATRGRAAAIAPGGKEWFGHPRGLSTLFFTEMWERFSYYGMRALLILFMTATVADGGLGFNVAKAGAIYALYTSLVYLANLPGGWVADRLLGQRRSVLYGGIIIAAGHFSMAVPTIVSFYLGLALIIAGTGMLKPNISVMVGQLYDSADARRDAGFSIFYMGINLGAFIAPLITAYLGENINWHLGFGAAGVGMTLGLVQYVLGRRYLGTAGLYPAQPSAESLRQDRRTFTIAAVIFVALMALLGVLAVSGTIQFTAEMISAGYGWVLLATVIGLFGWLFTRSYWSVEERKRLITIMVLFFAASVFWSAFEQAGSSLNLFAADRTSRTVLGWEFPAGWFQALNALFIVMLAPAFAWFWIYLHRKGKEPSSPGKFTIGLLFVGLGFVVMIGGAVLSEGGARVGPGWLVTTYLLHTIGELFLSPVGLSAMTKLAPMRVTSLMMGVWFLAASIGNYMAGFLLRFYESFTLPTIFGIVAAFSLAAALIMALVVGPIKRMLARAD